MAENTETILFQARQVGFDQVANRLRTVKRELFEISNNKIKDPHLKVLKQQAFDLTNRLNEQKTAMRDMEKSAGLMKNSMLQFGLSMLFGGMAIKRFFDTIAKDSFTTYNKLVANTQMANNATSQLTGAVTVLKFTMGEALNSVLEVLVPLLMPLLDKIIEFVQTHSKLVGWVVIIGILLGGLMMVVGQFVLLGLGLIAGTVLFGGLGTAGATAGTAMAGGMVKGIGGLLKTGLMILAVIAIWKTLFGLLTGDESAIKWVGKVITAIAGAVAYILYIFTKVIQTVASMFKVLGINVQWVFESIGRIMQNIFADIVNWVIDAINGLIKGWNWLAESKAGQLAGLGTIGEMKGKMSRILQSQVDFDRQERLKAEKERLAYYYSDEYAQTWKDAATQVGTDFENGMTKIADGFGYKQFTGESTTTNDTTKDDLIALANTQELAANTQQSAATNFKSAVDDFKQIAKDAKATNNKVYIDAFNNYNTTLPA